MPSYKFKPLTKVVSVLLTSAIPRIQREMGSDLSRVVDRYAGIMRRDMQLDIMTGKKSGRIYIRRKGKGKRRKTITHQSSAPGEAPANETGTLANSIKSRMIGPLTAQIDTGSNQYAAALDKGYAPRNLLPRPFFEKNINKNTPAFIKEVKDTFRRIRGL